MSYFPLYRCSLLSLETQSGQGSDRGVPGGLFNGHWWCSGCVEVTVIGVRDLVYQCDLLVQLPWQCVSMDALTL